MGEIPSGRRLKGPKRREMREGKEVELKGGDDYDNDDNDDNGDNDDNDDNDDGDDMIRLNIKLY